MCCVDVCECAKRFTFAFWAGDWSAKEEKDDWKVCAPTAATRQGGPCKNTNAHPFWPGMNMDEISSERKALSIAHVM